MGSHFYTITYVQITIILAGATTTSTSTSLRAHHTAGVVGCLRLLSTALLGLAPVQSAVVAEGPDNSTRSEAKGTGIVKFSFRTL